MVILKSMLLLPYQSILLIQSKGIMKKIAYLLMTCVILLTSACSDDDDSGKSSRLIKYEITGNFSGEILIVYTSASGGSSNATITSLPWSVEITVEDDVLGVAATAGGNSGTAGQTATLKIYAGGKVVESGSDTADSDGIISLSPGAHTF
jgi:hypothetical protein